MPRQARFEGGSSARDDRTGFLDSPHVSLSPEPLVKRDSYYAGPVLLALTAVGFHAVAYQAVESF
jgi:hypothetical protein